MDVAGPGALQPWKCHARVGEAPASPEERASPRECSAEPTFADVAAWYLERLCLPKTHTHGLSDRSRGSGLANDDQCAHRRLAVLGSLRLAGVPRRFFRPAASACTVVRHRVWSKNSCGRSVVELQEATETLAASHGPVLAHLLARKEEEVVLPLVIPLAVDVFDIRAQCGS